MLPIFHGKPFEDPYRHVDELSQVCEINHLQNVPADMMMMKLFPATLRDRGQRLVFKIRERIHKLDRDGGRVFKKILFRRKNHFRPKRHPRVHPRIE